MSQAQLPLDHQFKKKDKEMTIHEALNFGNIPQSHRSLTLKTRVIVFIIYSVSLLVISGVALGDWTPFGEANDAWLAATLAVVAFRLLSSPFFKRPSESLAAAFGSGLLLAPLAQPVSIFDDSLEMTLRFFGLLIVILAIFAAVSTMLLQGIFSKSPRVSHIHTISTSATKAIGGPEVLFLAPALISILLHADDYNHLSLLTVSWILVTTVEPFERGAYMIISLSSQTDSSELPTPVGVIERIDSPNLIRVSLTEDGLWNNEDVLISRTVHGHQYLVLPLFYNATAEGRIGTGLLIPDNRTVELPIRDGTVCNWSGLPDRAELESTLAGCDDNSTCSLIGFVVEGSTIEELRFETIPGVEMSEGSVCGIRSSKDFCYFQILDAKTHEEAFSGNPGGKIIAHATQLGIPQNGGGFVRRSWVPSMNAPVFRVKYPTELEQPLPSYQGLFLGYIPGTDHPILADFERLREYHTAILGVTGMGKTEMVFDVIRYGITSDTKVICVDFTGEYNARLSDLKPVPIGLDKDQLSELSNLIEDVETGEFSAAKEKKALTNFQRALRPILGTQISEFLEGQRSNLALFELYEISNTQATLRATELLLSATFQWAKRNRKKRNILLVLEEAHTIIPESNLFFRDRSETSAVLGRTAQVALQGRKYGVGVLLVSQRTALVSKTILSQCNTYVCFSMVDKTSLDYMENVCGSRYASVLPKLRPLQALVCGHGILSDRPAVLEIPFNINKERASRRLDGKF